MKPRTLLLILLLVLFFAGGGTVVVTKTRGEFLRLIENEARRQLGVLRPDLTDVQRTRAARILAAQAALESGYGSTRQWREGFNFGNVSKGSWTGPTLAGGDTEYDAAGNVKKITQAWRKYGSLAEAVSDFFKLLSWSRYVPARDALMRGDANGFAEKLRAGGYYTAPLAEYQAGIRSAISAAGGLPA